MSRARLSILVFAALVSAAVPVAAQTFSEGFTFLKAVRDGHGTKVQAIVSNPSSSAINARDPRSGEGALHILVKARNLEWLAYLLSRGARPDLGDNAGDTPLGLAAQLGWVEGATQILARGGQVDLANRRGETPLILAVQARHLSVSDRVEMVRLLLGQGADPNKQDSFAGYSALDYARQDSRAGDLVAALQAGTNRPAAGTAVGPNP